jgi:endogenous inhibitor of DNA gyrase (YacG/DUF329 family)
MSDGKVLPYRGAERARCPSCRRPAVARFRPFCSKRCADLDLHRWLSGSYAVPTDEAPPEEPLEKDEPEQE